MMNMKKLIEETDFDNLSEMTKRWDTKQKLGTSHFPEQRVIIDKQNDFKKSNQNTSAMAHQETKQQATIQNASNAYNKPVGTRKTKVLPQVIDEDTEHFRNKLEHLLNNFKTDAVSEFMNMKKQMLDYQQECVKTDTQKYLNMYEQKHKQLLDTKQKLIEMSRIAEKKSAQVQLLSDHIAKLNERMKTFKYVSRPFSILYESMVRGKELKFKMKEANKFDEKRLKRKSIWGWVGIYKQQKEEKQKMNNQQKVEREVNEIVGKFQKQMDMLKHRLSQALRKNDEYESNKHILQQNLKKAFLRGVCAMNMQAMGVLGTQNTEQAEWASEKSERQKNTSMNNYSYVEQKNTTALSRQDFMQNQSMINSKQTNKFVGGISMGTEHKSQNLVIQPQKAESKNNKWKEAPIVGVEESRQIQQPKMQVVRPTNEGKVIKVVEGKSSVQVKKSIAQKSRNVPISGKKQ